MSTHVRGDGRIWCKRHCLCYGESIIYLNRNGSNIFLEFSCFFQSISGLYCISSNRMYRQTCLKRLDRWWSSVFIKNSSNYVHDVNSGWGNIMYMSTLETLLSGCASNFQWWLGGYKDWRNIRGEPWGASKIFASQSCHMAPILFQRLIQNLLDLHGLRCSTHQYSKVDRSPKVLNPTSICEY